MLVIYKALLDEIFDGGGDAMFVSRPENILCHIARRVSVGCDFVDQLILLRMGSLFIVFVVALWLGFDISSAALTPAQLVQLFYVIVDLRTTLV